MGIISTSKDQKLKGKKRVYKLKEDVLDVKLAHYKARVIAKGFP